PWRWRSVFSRASGSASSRSGGGGGSPPRRPPAERKPAAPTPETSNATGRMDDGRRSDRLPGEEHVPEAHQERGQAAEELAAERYRAQARGIDRTAEGQIPLETFRHGGAVGGAMADQRDLDREGHAGHVGVERPDEAPVVVDERV